MPQVNMAPSCSFFKGAFWGSTILNWLCVQEKSHQLEQLPVCQASDVHQKSIKISQWVNEQKVLFPVGGCNPQQCTQLGEWSPGQSSVFPNLAFLGKGMVSITVHVTLIPEARALLEGPSHCLLYTSDAADDYLEV